MDQRPDDFRPPRLPADQPVAPRLSPTMASQRLLVLDFVRDYIDRWGDSPSLGEIGAKLGIDRMRVKRAIRSLAADGMLLRTPGPRGLAMPGAEAEALRQLRALGWTINPTEEVVTKATLLPPAALDYEEPSAEGPSHDGTAESGKESS